MRSFKKILLFASLFSLLVFVAFPATIVFMASEDLPVVGEMQSLGTDAGIRAKRLAQKIKSDLFGSEKTVTQKLEEKDLNNLVALLSRSIRGVWGRSNISKIGMLNVFSVHTPKNPFGPFINIQVALGPSDRGLNVENVKIGSIELSGKTGLKLFTWVMNLSVGNNFGTRLVNSIQSVKLDDRVVWVRYQPIPDIRDGRELSKGKFRRIKKHAFPLADRESIRHYYGVLCERAKKLGKGRHSLSAFLHSLFSSAAQKSINGSAIYENRAAILAMAILLGNERFQMATGYIVGEGTGYPGCASLVRRVVLNKRRDLRLHFVYSAAIKILSDREVSNTVVEFKELVDLGKKKSGFSFVDLAADFAGIQFASMAVQDEASARKLQQILQENQSERVFFPEVTGLFEGFTEEEFRKYYVDVDSVQYREVVKDIHSRLEKLELYRK